MGGRCDWKVSRGPIQNPIEMDHKLDDCVAKLNKIPGYKQQFQKVFGTDCLRKYLQGNCQLRATVLSGNAPYDKYKAGNHNVMSVAAERGMKLFFGKAHCSACHTGANFSDESFHNIGVGIKAEKPDLGRYEVTKVVGDKGAFKTPTLREVARHAPYMHDGSLKTLEDVVEHYDKGGVSNAQLDEEIFPLKFSATEKSDLITFMKEGLATRRLSRYRSAEVAVITISDL